MPPGGAAHHARLIGVGEGAAGAEGRGRLLENLLPRGEEAAQHARLLAGLPSGRLQSAGHSLLLLLLVEHSARSHTGHAHASDSAQRGLAEAGRAALGGQVQAVGPLFIANARRRRPTAREEAAEGSAARHRELKSRLTWRKLGCWSAGPASERKLEGHQAANAVHLAHVEAVLVHVAVHVDDLAGAKGQFHLKNQKKSTPTSESKLGDSSCGS
ncbi:hypothetical protein TYRP_015594 [Tyrophagus putrescentiae]|nr:hypothetical protein TYRP_015594 [Tyrophagus putrescentiae]